MTCQHKPFLANNGQVSQAWDSCMGPGMNTTIDSGDNLLPLVMLNCRHSTGLTSVGISMHCVADNRSLSLPFFLLGWSGKGILASERACDS